MANTPGCATISGIAVLENPRFENSQTLLFDSHLFFYDESSSTNLRLALLRYFNIDNLSFNPDEPCTYFIVANVARMEAFCAPDKLTVGMEHSDYVFVGDIVQIIPIDGVDPKHRPFISVCGVVTSYDRTATTKKIEVAPSVFTYVLSNPKKSKDLLPASSPSQSNSAVFPVGFIVPDTSRWAGERAPKVSVGTYVCLEGFLHMVHRSSDGMVTSFDAELDKVTFMGRAHAPAIARKSLPVPSDSSPSTPPTKRMRFSYTDSTPSSLTRKRKFDDYTRKNSDVSLNPSSSPAGSLD
ncbi:hypothetical protein F5880DRAFT_1685299 [Lentinula raphanica]|nr:hypothetical protein F5880DRAFT_1685299 [Lentinula raphanica]